ncbi:MAG: OmpA family protein, partial [Betaproteobacteria bacterium]|nr:OmpA family protein [Betaproteobacteria bacterium]
MLAFAGLTSAAEINNWLSSSGEVWKNAYGECWRNSSWTPATAAPGCDGAIVEQPAAAPAAQNAAPAPAPKVDQAPAAVQ